MDHGSRKQPMSIFRFTRQTRNLILVMLVIVVLGVLAAWIYYRHENAAVDPRIMDARLMLKQYDELMKEGAFEEGMVVLDSIESIYKRVPCYAHSFEMGVINNNRASAWLTMALYKTNDSLQKVEMLELARREIIKSIKLFTTGYFYKRGNGHVCPFGINTSYISYTINQPDHPGRRLSSCLRDEG